ncbi:hypothetical protein GCM10018954_080000 [Kutzneria kofuensis]
MRDALTGHGIVFSICEKTDFGRAELGLADGRNLWAHHRRHPRQTAPAWCRCFHTNVTLPAPGRSRTLERPDMLEVGNGGMSDVGVTGRTSHCGRRWPRR